MEILKKCLKVLSNVQILSALIWAAVILLCSYVSKDNSVSNILITAAGFHVVLMSFKSDKTSSKSNILTNKA